MSKKLAKITRSDGWDRKLEDAVSAMLQAVTTDVARCDVCAVVDVIAEAFGVRIAAKKDNGKALFERLGLKPVNRLSARRGDVGVMTIDGHSLAGVFSIVGFVVRLPHGASIFPVSDIDQAYQIGA